MNTYDPIELLFGGMEKLGPGGNVHTLHVLSLIPKQQFSTIVDAGCGAGRQTMVLMKELGTLVHAVDSYEPFLNDLTDPCCSTSASAASDSPENSGTFSSMMPPLVNVCQMAVPAHLRSADCLSHCNDCYCKLVFKNMAG